MKCVKSMEKVNRILGWS